MLLRYIYLLLAIVFETIATSCLKQSEQFSKLWPSVMTIVCYGASFYFLSIVLKTIPIGIVQTVIGFPGHFRDGYDYSRSGNNQSVFKGCFALKKYDRLTSKSTYKGRERRQINICFLKYFKYFCGAEIASYISYLLNDGI